MKELYDTLMVAIKDYEPQYKELILKAYEIAKFYHANQYRRSGEEYIIHPIHVAITLANMKSDANSISAGLLHDTLEDTKLTRGVIEKELNSDIGDLVEGVTKINNTNFSTRNEARSANERKLIVSMSKDIRIVIIKLADRLHNMQTLQFQPTEKQQYISFETLDIYAPLARYIGAYELTLELEDLAFKYLEPNEYEIIENESKRLLTKYCSSLKTMLQKIKDILNNHNIPNEIKYNIRSIYNIYKKTSQFKTIEHMPNLFYFQIAVNNLMNCYSSLGLVHSLYKPKNDMFLDLIANPQYNTYRSLHTTVYGEGDLLMQTQIRTFDQDLIASYGLTAYWKLNPIGARKRMQNQMRNEFQYYKSIHEIDSNLSDNELFLSRIKDDLFSSKIRVKTIDGNSYEIIKGTKLGDFLKRTNLGDINTVLINGLSQTEDYVLIGEDQITLGHQYVNLPYNSIY